LVSATAAIATDASIAFSESAGWLVVPRGDAKDIGSWQIPTPTLGGGANAAPRTAGRKARINRRE